MRKTILLSMIFGLAILFLGCATDSDDTDDNSSSNLNTITGIATKGPIDGGTVTAYKLNEDGTRGENLGSVITDESGQYQLAFAYSGAVELVVSGGSYIDEATGTKVQLTEQNQLRTCLHLETKNTSAAITPLTTMATERVKEQIQTQTQTQEQLKLAISDANNEVANFFGLDGVDISKTNPADLTNAESAQKSESAKKYGAVLAGLSEMSKEYTNTNQLEVMNMIKTMAEDFSDGEMDGLKNQEQLQNRSTIMEQVHNDVDAQNSYQKTIQNRYQTSVQNFLDNNEQNKCELEENMFLNSAENESPM